MSFLTRPRSLAASLALFAVVVLGATPASAQALDLGSLIAILRELLDVNTRILEVESDHYDLVVEISRDFRKPIPRVHLELPRDYRDDAIGYVEDELGPIHQILRDGRVDPDNRKDYELAFGSVPDTPHAALSQLIADDVANFLMTKSGENVRLIADLKRDFERLAEEKQAYPDRAEELTRQQDLVQQRVATLSAELEGYRAQADAVQLAINNEYRKNEEKAKLQTASELVILTKGKRPMWMFDTSESGEGGFAAE